MFLGSLSGLPATSEGLTGSTTIGPPGWVPPAPGPRSSTPGLPSGFTSELAQPYRTASATTAHAATNDLFMPYSPLETSDLANRPGPPVDLEARMLSLCGDAFVPCIPASRIPEERPPRRLANVGRLHRQPLLHAAVARHRRQHPASADVGRVQQHAAVRREARRLVARAVGEQLRLAARQVHDREPELAIDPRDVRERLAVRAHARRHIVAAFEGETGGVAALRRHPVDLRAAA